MTTGVQELTHLRGELAYLRIHKIHVMRKNGATIRRIEELIKKLEKKPSL